MARDADRNTILLKEYEVCQSSAQALEATIWQSAGLIGLASIGTLALLATSSPSFIPALVVGILSSAASFMWWLMARRWWSIQHAKFRRMRHIETALQQPGQMHYISFLDDLHLDFNPSPVKAGDPRYSRVPALADQYSLQGTQADSVAQLEYHRRGPVEILNYFPLLTTVAWAVYLGTLLVPWLSRVVHIFFYVVPTGVWSIPGA